MRQLGLHWDKLKREKGNAANSELQSTRELILNELEPLIETRQHYLEHKHLSDRKLAWLACLDEFSR